MQLKLSLFLFCLFFANCSNSETIKEIVEPVEEEMNTSTRDTVFAVTFSAPDGLVISGDLYQVAEDAPVFVLCHQSGFNRTEHSETANTLMERGYNCLTIDQRAGGLLNDEDNETAKRAIAEGFPLSFLDAEQDIIAAINFMVDRYNQPVILLGSSYSSSLSLKIATENQHVKAVLAFSPGEYFGNDLNVATAITGLDKPTFMTSAKGEALIVQPLAAVVNQNQITHFIPEANGAHGARVLWPAQVFSEEYWTALNAFLAKHEL